MRVAKLGRMKINLRVSIFRFCIWFNKTNYKCYTKPAKENVEVLSANLRKTLRILSCWPDRFSPVSKILKMNILSWGIESSQIGKNLSGPRRETRCYLCETLCNKNTHSASTLPLPELSVYLNSNYERCYWHHQFDTTRRNRTGKKLPKGFFEITY